MLVKLLKKAIEDYQIRYNPRKYVRHFLKNSELTLPDKLDTKCIFSEYRFNPQTVLSDGFFARYHSLSIRENVALPITKITQIRCSSSASATERYCSVADFGKSNYELNIKCEYKNDIPRLLKEAIKQDRIVKVIHYSWANEYLWNNTDGSHRFSIACYHSINEQKEYLWPVILTTITFDIDAFNRDLGTDSVWITHTQNKIIINDLKNILNLEFESLDYPMRDNHNVILRVKNDSNVVKDVLNEFSNFFIPFGRLFSVNH